MSSESITEPDIKAGDYYSAWRTERLYPEQFSALSDKDRLLYLAKCAHLAPSTHNTQPWAFQLFPDENTVVINLDKGYFSETDGQILDQRRVLPESDIVGRQACLSIGCCTANLITAARYFGFTIMISYYEMDKESVKPILAPRTDAPRYIPMVNLRLEQDSGTSLVSRQAFEAIFNRAMNRAKYDVQKPVDSSIVSEMKVLAAENQVSLHILTRKKPMDKVRLFGIATLQGGADKIVAQTERFCRELGEWFLPNDSSSYLGMPGDTFGLDNEMARKIHLGLLSKDGLSSDEIDALSNNGKSGIESSSLVGVLTVPSDIPQFWIKAGIVLEDIALLLQQRAMTLAIHAGLAEVSFTSRPLSKSLSTDERAVILFRAGYPQNIYPHSPRLPIREVLI